MQLSLQLSKLQGTTSYFDGNMGRVGVKSDTVLGYLASYHEVKNWVQRWILTFFLLPNFQKILKFSSIFVPVPFCKLVRIWTLLLSIYIDSKDLQSNFEVPVVCGSTYFWVSLYKLPTVLLRRCFIYHSHLYCQDPLFNK